MERERSGDWNLLEEEEEEEVVVVVVEDEVEEGEGDMYLEDTCLPFGLLGMVLPLLLFSEGSRD